VARSELTASCPFADCDPRRQRTLAFTLGKALEKATRRELAGALEVRAVLVRAEPKAGSPLARTLATARRRVDKLVDDELRALVSARGWDEAEALLAAHEGARGRRWGATSRKTVARAASRSTELIDSCSASRSWSVCRGALEALVGACGDALPTCNRASCIALDRALAPLLDSDEHATDEALLAISKNIRFLDGLSARDPLRRLGERAFRIARERIEAAIVASTEAGDPVPARLIASAHDSDFGAAWVSRMLAVVAAEERLRERAGEAELTPRARKACVRRCARARVQCGGGLLEPCDSKRERCCAPKLSDCERYAPLRCGE